MGLRLSTTVGNGGAPFARGVPASSGEPEETVS